MINKPQGSSSTARHLSSQVSVGMHIGWMVRCQFAQAKELKSDIII